MKFAISSICTAFQSRTIGSKVLDTNLFFKHLENHLEQYDTSKDLQPGQHFLAMPDCDDLVSAGDGEMSHDPSDYVIRDHREGPKMFLRREKAGKVNFVACVVYTRQAYLADPEVLPEEEEEIGGATHVIVAVIASSGPKAPLTPFRFVSNLAGGNLEAEKWTADEIREKAKEIKEYWTKYSVVAD